MEFISVSAAITLTEWSERTVRRKLADGLVAPENGGNGKSLLRFESVKPHICITLEPDDLPVLMRADAGDAEAQTDLALIFLSQDKPKGAMYWLELAAKQDYAEAMHWLGRCHIEGKGVPQDENLGIMWLAKSAAHGHAISQAQMEAMRDSFTSER